MNTIQLFSFAVTILIVCLLVYWFAKRKSRLRLIPIGVWALHMLSFYTGILLHVSSYTGIKYTDWSAVLRLHGLLTVLMVVMYYILVNTTRRNP